MALRPRSLSGPSSWSFREPAKIVVRRPRGTITTSHGERRTVVSALQAKGATSGCRTRQVALPSSVDLVLAQALALLDHTRTVGLSLHVGHVVSSDDVCLFAQRWRRLAHPPARCRGSMQCDSGLASPTQPFQPPRPFREL